MEPEKKSPNIPLRWTIALAYTLLIFTLAWFIVPLWNWLTETLGTENAGVTVDRAVPILGALLLALVLIRFRLPTFSAYLWLAAVAAAYTYLLTLHAEYPVERVHLIQYSLVAFLYFRAVKPNRKNRTATIAAAIAVFVVGFTDEIVQEHLIPNRSGTLDDMLLNWAAGTLGLIALIAFRPDGFWPKYARFRRPIRVATGFVFPLLIAALATHQIYTRYLYPPLNLLIITVDCARPDRFSIYGHDRVPPTSMYLDAIAKDGAVFNNAFSQAAWTGPGVISTLSGLYPPTHGVDAAGSTLPKSVYTLLDAFKDHGYRVPNLSYLTVDPTFQNLADMEPTGIDVSTKNEIAAINQWIGENHREPLAMWYHWRFMHLPYDPPTRHWVYEPANHWDYDPATNTFKRNPEHRQAALDSGVTPEEIAARPGQLKRFIEQPEKIRDLIRKEVIVPYYPETLLENPDAAEQMFREELPQATEFTQEEVDWINALYDAQIRHFDHALESLRYKLALHHKLKNTIIVITADHGEELGEHGFIGHGSTAVHSRHYDEHIHIPLMIMCPRVIKKGRIIDTIAQQIDILPTVLDMMGWDIPEEAQGRSLLPAIRGEQMEDVPAFAESVEGGYQAKPHQRNQFVRSLRTKDWKFIARMSPTTNQLELYNLIDDPGETINVFDDYPHIAGPFIQQIGQWITQNLEARLALEEKEALLEARVAAMDPANLSVPEIVTPNDGDTIYYETHNGAIQAQWTGNPHAAYIIEYDVGESWHRLKGKYPVEIGTQQIFGPLPRDGWKPLYQWNPYRVRVRPRDLPNGWSPWITLNVAPLASDQED